MKRVVWNEQERRPRALVRVVLHALMVLVAMLLAAVSARALPRGELAVVAAFALQTIGVVSVTWIAVRVLDRRSIADLGILQRRGAALDLGFGVLLGGACIAGVVIAERVTGIARYRVVIDAASRAPSVLGALAVFVCVAIVEELVFRGYMITNLAEGARPRLWRRSAVLLALALSSIAFGLAHAPNPNASAIAVGNVAVAGVFLGAGYVVLGDLAVPLGVHLGWNLAQALFGMPVSGLTFLARSALVERELLDAPEWLSGGAFGPEAGVTGLVAMLVGLAQVLLWSRARGARIAAHPRLGVPRRETLQHE